MSSIVLNGDTSGSVTVSVPAVSGSNTVTIPATTGTVMVSSNMPAFSAYVVGSQTPSSGTPTKVQFNTKIYDTATCFNTSNYRFTPTVAGYYQVNALLTWGTTASATYLVIDIYKNGSSILENAVPSSSYCGATNSCGTVTYMNGTTDYLEIYAFNGAGGIATSVGGTNLSNFSACLVRGA